MAVAPRASLDEELELLFSGDLDTIQDPYPIYDRLREEAPVRRFGTQTALISRHHDVRETFRDHPRFPQPLTRGNPFDGRLALLSEDDLRVLAEIHEFESNFISRKSGAEHRRVRATAHRYFTPSRVAQLEQTFQQMFDDLLEAHADPSGFDFMPVAYGLPLLVICELLGVPREDAAQVKAWGDAINPKAQNPLQPAGVRAQRQGIEENGAYVRELVSRHRLNPERSELIASVLDATDGDRLSEEELVAFFVHTLFAGHETTQHMIGNGLYAFMRHRDQWDRLSADPELAASAVEEVMRFDSPVPSFSKITAEEVELDSVTIPKGIVVLLMLSAANRDPAVFTDPSAFDIARRPNDQLSLGHGVHHCLGASLARLEGRIVFGTLARCYPDLELAVDASELRYHQGIRGLDELPVKLGRRRGD